jgi:hypothetical protein
MAKKRTSFAFSELTLQKIKLLSEKHHLSQAAVLEKLVREARA